MKYGLLVMSCVLTLSACSGPSREEQHRMEMLRAQQAEQAALAAQQEAALREQRITLRTAQAEKAWQQQNTLSTKQINSLFSSNAENSFSADETYFIQFELQAAKYNYSAKKQSFTIVGMRNLPNSADYSPLFPDDEAMYQPGQQAKSVLEFTLKEDTEENRLGQQVLRDRGQRWVAAMLNFKTYGILTDNNAEWLWEPGLFEDISWQTTPEAAYPYTSARSVVLQLGVRLCTLERCYLDTEYRKHPTHAVRAEVVSATVGDRKSKKILAQFIREAE